MINNKTPQKVQRRSKAGETQRLFKALWRNVTLMLAMTPSGSGLARQSVDAWNAWVAEHDGWHVDFRAVDFTKACNAEISFQDFRYSGAVNFRSAVFNEAVFRGW